jgi:hypothetical protein
MGTLPGDDRLEQKVRGPRYDILRCWPFGADFDLADAAKRADNSVTSALDSRRGRRSQGGLWRKHVLVGTNGPVHTKKARIVCWKAAIGQWTSGSAA